MTGQAKLYSEHYVIKYVGHQQLLLYISDVLSSYKPTSSKITLAITALITRTVCTMQ